MSDDIKNPDRRKFLTVLGATGGGALALSGCSTRPVEKLIPYLIQSEDQVPGVPTWFASTCTECASACGVHVKTREGRAIKLEGNPDHPVSRGKLCARGQASLQGLYNPGRVKGPMLPSDTPPGPNASNVTGPNPSVPADTCPTSVQTTPAT